MTRTIRTLGQAARHHMLVRAECAPCGKAADFWASDLAHFYGHGRDIESVPFRCSDCSQPATRIQAMLYQHDERSPRVVWRPVKVK